MKAQGTQLSFLEALEVNGNAHLQHTHPECSAMFSIRDTTENALNTAHTNLANVMFYFHDF